MTSAVPGSGLVSAILRRAETDGDRRALVGPNRTLTYRELAQAVYAYAEVVSARVAPTTGPVALWAGRELETIVAQLGVMLAGHAYVPLNPADPPTRQRVVLAAAGVRHLVGDDLPRPRLDAVPTVAAAIAEPAADRLAYVLSTSGSTGVPKAVPITHGNALAFVTWAAATFGLGVDDVVGVYAPLYFDLAVLDVYVGLRSGATLVLVPDETARFGAAVHDVLASAGVTSLYAVPSAFLAVARARRGVALTALRQVLLAGETFPVNDFDLLRSAAPNAQWHNLYGPIETNVISHFAVPAAWPAGAALPIGDAASGATLALIDDDGRLVTTPGARGELVVSGPSVFDGYLDTGAPPPSPFIEAEGRRWFRTGDDVSVLLDAGLAFHGRRDHRFKRNGFLVEPAEIEAALRCEDAIAAAAVVTVPGRAGPVVHAFVVPAHPDSTLTTRSVLRHCASLLPRFMWPERVHIVSHLPTGRTGKIDRTGLVALASIDE